MYSRVTLTCAGGTERTILSPPAALTAAAAQTVRSNEPAAVSTV